MLLSPPVWLFALAYGFLTALLIGFSPMLAFVPVLFALALIPLLRAPRNAALAVLFLAPLLSGLPRGQIVPYFRPNELVLIVAFIAYALVYFLGRVRRPVITFLDGAFLILLAARCIVPFLAHPLAVTADPTYLVKFFLAPFQYYLLYRLILGTTSSREDLIVLMRVIVAASVVVAIVGLLQAMRVHEIEVLLRNYYPSNKTVYTFEHSRRVTSLFSGAWNVCGYYLSQALLLSIVLRRFEKPGIPRTALTCVTVLLAVVMGLTFSFTTVITLFAALAFIGLKEGKLRGYLLRFLAVGAVLGLLLVIGFGASLQERLALQFRGTWIPMTILTRLDFWINTALPLVSSHLLFGIGPSLYDWVTAENHYLFLAANGGLVSLAGFLFFIGLVWRKFSRLFRRIAAAPRGPARDLAHSLSLLSLAFLLQALIASMTGHYFEYSGATEMLWSVWSMAIVAERLSGGRPLDNLTPSQETS
jgi:hypothetical protein